MSSAKPISYAEDIRQPDTERALETLTVALFPNETSPTAIDFQGTCPRCGDPIQIRRWIVAVAGALKLNDKQMEVLSACREDCERLEKLMRDLLDLSRIEAGESKPILEPIRTSEPVSKTKLATNETARVMLLIIRSIARTTSATSITVTFGNLSISAR